MTREHPAPPPPPEYMKSAYFKFLGDLINDRACWFFAVLGAAHADGIELNAVNMQHLFDLWVELGCLGQAQAGHKLVIAQFLVRKQAGALPHCTEQDVNAWAHLVSNAPNEFKHWLKASFPLFVEHGPEKLVDLVQACASYYSSGAPHEELCSPGGSQYRLSKLFAKFIEERPDLEAQRESDRAAKSPLGFQPWVDIQNPKPPPAKAWELYQAYVNGKSAEAL